MTVLVLAAMPEESGAVVEAMSARPSGVFAGVETWRAEVAGEPVLIARTGIGLVNAAASVAGLLTRLELEGTPARAVLSAGSAAGMGEGIAVGDVLVGDTFALGDPDATAFGYVPGQVPGMPAEYPADAALIALLPAVADETGLRVTTGLVVSTDSFLVPELGETLRSRYPAMVSADMESAAIAQVAHRHGIAFATVRGISDLADSDDGSTFDENLPTAAANSARAVIALIGALAAAPVAPPAEV